jgi:elongation factor 2
MMGKNAETMTSVPAGNTVAITGIDQFLLKQGTISNCEEAHTIKTMKFTVSPIVRVAVEAKYPVDLPKLIEGLKKLSKADPLVRCSTESTGQHIIACSGELHAEVCIRDLQVDYAKIEIKTSEPVVSYKETVLEESSEMCLAKSTNKHNRLYAKCGPLDESLVTAIEDEEIGPLMDPKERKNKLRDEFGWDPEAASKIWCFGPDETGPNILVNATSQVQYLNDIRDSVVAGFGWVSKEGALTEENLRGVRFDIIDAKIHSDNMHRGAGQIIPAARRVFYAAQLTAKPSFQEPVFLVDIQVPEEIVGAIYNLVSKRRGVVIEQEPVEGTPIINVKAHLPVAESFGFNDALKAATKGRAFPTMIFDHWASYGGDPLDSTSKAATLVDKIRARKGLKVGVPNLANFNDKL